MTTALSASDIMILGRGFMDALAYNLANFLRTLALPREIAQWSLTSLREKVVKIGAKVVATAAISSSRWPRWRCHGSCFGASSIGSRGYAQPSWPDADPRRTSPRRSQGGRVSVTRPMTAIGRENSLRMPYPQLVPSKSCHKGQKSLAIWAPRRTMDTPERTSPLHLRNVGFIVFGLNVPARRGRRPHRGP